MGNTYQTVTLVDAISAIQEYNEEIYGKSGRKNVEIDAEGKALFKSGLGVTEDAIGRQVKWIGKDYGGTANTLASIKLPGLIAADIYRVRDVYSRQISALSPLIKKTPRWEEIRTLYRPFEQVLRSPQGKRTWKDWITWATKFWHFLNPEVFSIMDSRARRFYQIRSGSAPGDAYAELLERCRWLLINRQDWLPKLRSADGSHAWSDIKLFDKVAYELGK